MDDAGLFERVPTFRFDRLEYFRQEKEGYLTVRSATHPETNEVVLNPTAGQIIGLCDGSRSVAGVVGAMTGLYPQAPKDLIERDVTTMLSSLSRMRVIEWDGPDPFHNPHAADLGSGWRGRLAGEDDARAIMGFLAAAPAATPAATPDATAADWFHYRSPLLAAGGLSEVEVRQGLYARLDHYFLLTTGDDVKGLVNVRSPFPYGSRLATVRLILVPRDCPAAPALLTYAVDLLPTAAAFPLTGVRLFHEPSAPLDPGLARLLGEADFKAEMTLRDELGPGRDLIVLRYSLGGA